MSPYVRDLADLDPTHVALAGGKGASLGELARIPGVEVPPGFCVTTDAWREIRSRAAIGDALDRLSRLRANDRQAIAGLAATIRAAIEAVPLPADLAGEIVGAHARLGAPACAVRSSATAEDGPSTSFAGQHDSHLDVVGPEAILRCVSRCWASLFTERAVSYRLRAGLDPRAAQMAVVVQRMVAARAAGVMFTADPVGGNRRVVSIEAIPGTGEALVAGRAGADVYTVRDGAIAAARRERAALEDAQILHLAGLGRRIEAHLGAPQDIEWCLAGDVFHFVQARPITTLFPVPAAEDDQNRVYVSVGHNQMMTDAMRPLGISLWQRITPAPMKVAGGRLFVDVTPHLASPLRREALLELMGRGDPLVRDALETVLARGFVAPMAGEPVVPTPAAPPPLEDDPAIVEELIERTRASLAALERDIRPLRGTVLLDFILADVGELRRHLFDPRSHQATMAGIEATWWLNDHLHEWLGERDAADALALAAPGNVTSEMGLSLLDVADVIRPHPEVVAFLRSAPPDFLEHLPGLAGGVEVRGAIAAFLARHGMRCAGEIDVTRPRWSERPTTLLPVLLGHVDTFAPGEAARRLERGRAEAARREREILDRLRALPGGEEKAAETARRIGRLRTFIGYREFPKYGMVCRTFLYKRALLEEAGRLVHEGVLQEKEDIFQLTLEELRDVVHTRRADPGLVRERAEAFRAHQALTPPRVLTSEGERVAGSYRREQVPPGALVGLPVSAGVVQGRARVIADIATADVKEGDILVTAYTDPSWTPLFVTVRGLVTEVGGLMTHGSVIAREYGLPAVVGVENATRLVRDGQLVRVDGTRGTVELLGEGNAAVDGA